MFARPQTHRLGEAQPEPVRERSADVRLALRLTYITIGWMTIEGAASLLLGWASKSLLLRRSELTASSNFSALRCCCGDCESKRVALQHLNASILLRVAQRV